MQPEGPLVTVENLPNRATCARVGAALALAICCSVLATGHVSADSGPDHQVAQSYPIELGTSGGNTLDRSSIYCCSGTLGALLQDNAGTHFILSNNHVLGRSNQAAPGEPVNQPGMVDQNCGTSGVIATVSYVQPLIFGSRKSPGGPNAADAAIAAVLDPSYVATDGSILDIGPVGASVLEPTVGLSVQKSGRTSGHTTGTVSAIGVDVVVGYSSSCGGPSKSFALFTNQFRISDGNFSASGDSGSLIVENVAPFPNLPRAVGLLFAGSSTSTVASPISAVLGAFQNTFGLNLSMVSGTPPPPPASGSISGTVTDDTLHPLAGATVTVADTGDSATTDGAGGYTIANVPVGTHDVTASASGYATAAPKSVDVLENQTASGVDFALTVATVATQSSVACIVYDTNGGPHHDKNMTITVRVVDDLGQPVSGAQVDISVTLNGNSFGTGSGALTSSTGETSYNVRNAQNGNYETTVSAVIASGLTFDGVTPTNAFAKGTDATPASFCSSSANSASTTQSGSQKVSVAHALQVKQQHGRSLLNLPGVVGHGVGLSNHGQAVIEVYVENERAARGVPSSLDGVPVKVLVTGEFVAF